MIIRYGCAKLRAIEERDAELLLYLINAPEIEGMTVGWCFPISHVAQREWMEHFRNSDKSLKLMIELENSKTIGMVALEKLDWKNRTAELGYKISAEPEDRIKGDMVDAVRGILKYAFEELGMNCIYGEVLEDNAFSRKLSRRAGFVEEGVLRKRVYKGGRYQNLVAVSILREEFEEMGDAGGRGC